MGLARLWLQYHELIVRTQLIAKATLLDFRQGIGTVELMSLSRINRLRSSALATYLCCWPFI